MAKKALLVGINKYPGADALRGCVNDVYQMRDVLTQKYGFATADLKFILDGDATREALVAGLAWLAEPVPGGGRGDVRVFHYSGHGAQIADQNMEEPDGADECLVPVDFRTTNRMLSDDELERLYNRVPLESSLTMVIDSCHSGTSQKDLARPEISYRFIEPTMEVRMAIARARETFVAERQRIVEQEIRDLLKIGPLTEDEIDQRVKAALRRVTARMSRYGDVANRERNLLFAGCRANQSSADAPIANDWHGAFTYYLVEAIAESGVNASCRTIMAKTAEKLKTGKFTQIPQLEGRTGVKDLPLFSPLP